MTRRARAAAAAALIVLGCAAEAPIPEADLAITVAAPDTEVRYGEEFPLTIVRIWSRDLEPLPIGVGGQLKRGHESFAGSGQMCSLL